VSAVRQSTARSSDRGGVTLWLDNQLPPALAGWLRATLSVACVPVRDLKLHRASDAEIFSAARDAQAVVMTKDADFAALVHQRGAPPQVVLVTCGNTSNARLRHLVEAAWPAILPMLERGEALVELGEHAREVPPDSR
jgi:predicted nuclease of predicted toxin-antitoxin system